MPNEWSEGGPEHGVLLDTIVGRNQCGEPLILDGRDLIEKEKQRRCLVAQLFHVICVRQGDIGRNNTPELCLDPCTVNVAHIK